MQSIEHAHNYLALREREVVIFTSRLAEREGIRTLGWLTHHGQQADRCLILRRPLQTCGSYRRILTVSMTSRNCPRRDRCTYWPATPRACRALVQQQLAKCRARGNKRTCPWWIAGFRKHDRNLVPDTRSNSRLSESLPSDPRGTATLVSLAVH
jgi:hypothetical protein